MYENQALQSLCCYIELGTEKGAATSYTNGQVSLRFMAVYPSVFQDHAPTIGVC